MKNLSETSLVILAAGRGSRFGGAKQFHPFGQLNKTLMSYNICHAIDNGCRHVVFITQANHKDQLIEKVITHLPENIKYSIVFQDNSDLPSECKIASTREKPLRTAHALWCARQVIPGNFCVINADDYYGKEAFEGAANFIKSNNSNKTYGIVGYSLKDTLSEHGSVSRGVCSVDDGHLVSIEEHTKIEAIDGDIIDTDSGNTLNPDTTVSMNFWICNPSIFEYIETYFTKFLQILENLEKSEIYIPFVAQEMMTNGLIDINVITTNSEWFGVTYYEDKAEAVNTLQRLTEDKKYPSPLWK